MQISKRFASYRHFDRGNSDWSDRGSRSESGLATLYICLYNYWYYAYLEQVCKLVHLFLELSGLLAEYPLMIKVILHQFWVKKFFHWKFNLEYSGTFTNMLAMYLKYHKAGLTPTTPVTSIAISPVKMSIGRKSLTNLRSEMI
jgi:hypothetical protein